MHHRKNSQSFEWVYSGIPQMWTPQGTRCMSGIQRYCICISEASDVFLVSVVMHTFGIECYGVRRHVPELSFAVCWQERFKGYYCQQMVHMN